MVGDRCSWAPMAADSRQKMAAFVAAISASLVSGNGVLVCEDQEQNPASKITVEPLSKD